MGFRPGAYATVWQTQAGKGNFTDVRLSISRKVKDSDQYEDEFSGYCMFIGEARAKAEKLKERDRIKLGDTDVTRRYDREKQKEYYTFKVFSFEFCDNTQSSGGGSSNAQPADQNPVDSNPADELPF